MGMTMTEKILARGAGRDSVRPGDLVLAKVDFAMGHDLTIPPAGKIMREQMGAEKIWDPERVAVTQDHFQPAKDAASATLGRLTREFSRDMGIKWYFEVGQGGICHTVLPEHGLVLPGELVVGADSHSCTYGALNNFATGIGSTDLACVLSLGELWFRVPETLKFVYHNRLKEWVEAKDLILAGFGHLRASVRNAADRGRRAPRWARRRDTPSRDCRAAGFRPKALPSTGCSTVVW